MNALSLQTYRCCLIMSDLVLHIPLASLDELLVQELRQRYEPATVELVVHTPSADWLDEEQFWQIMAMLDWEKSGQDDAVLAPAAKALSTLPITAIHQFEDVLAKKLWLLDTPAHAAASLANRPDAALSADGFLYDRCCVVANGRVFYEEVLRNPAKMPADFSFGRLLSLPKQAYRIKTGKHFIHIPRYSYETYSNEVAWAEE